MYLAIGPPNKKKKKKKNIYYIQRYLTALGLRPRCKKDLVNRCLNSSFDTTLVDSSPSILQQQFHGEKDNLHNFCNALTFFFLPCNRCISCLRAPKTDWLRLRNMQITRCPLHSLLANRRSVILTIHECQELITNETFSTTNRPFLEPGEKSNDDQRYDANYYFPQYARNHSARTLNLFIRLQLQQKKAQNLV